MGRKGPPLVDSVPVPFYLSTQGALHCETLTCCSPYTTDRGLNARSLYKPSYPDHGVGDLVAKRI